VPKKKSEYPEQIVVRLTTEQITYLQDCAEASGFKVSDLVRALIQVSLNAAINEQVDEAIATLDREVPHAAV
jgi:hypothetical protein